MFNKRNAKQKDINVNIFIGIFTLACWLSSVSSTNNDIPAGFISEIALGG